MQAILLVLLVQGILVTLNAQPCNQDGATRLLNFTPDVYAGFVQVCLNRTWGTVCADSPTTLWSEKNGQVFCIGLGFSGALNSVNQSTLPSEYLVQNGSAINYRDVRCDGNEATLSQCSHSTNTNGCDHTWDAAVVCRQSAGDGDIRLVGSTANGKGEVQIYSQKTSLWYRVCPSGWSDDDAAVVCRQLGYSFGTISLHTALSSRASSLPQTSVSCNSARCFVTSEQGCSAPFYSTAAVICSNYKYNTSLLTRLVGSSIIGVGRAEVFYNGVWGTMCNNNGWTSADAQALCGHYVGGNLSLAMVGSASILTDSASLKPIWLSGTTCNISTARCSYTLPIGYGLSCNHSKDIVLYCYGPPTPAPPTSAPGTVPSPFYCLGSTDPPILSMIPCPQSICVVMPPQRCCSTCTALGTPDNICPCVSKTYDFDPAIFGIVGSIVGLIPVSSIVGFCINWWRKRKMRKQSISENAVLHTRIMTMNNPRYSSIEQQ